MPGQYLSILGSRVWSQEAHGWGSTVGVPPYSDALLVFPSAPSLPAASAFIIAMLLASLNSCCNPWIYLLFTGHLFHELVQRFLCCSQGYVTSGRQAETSVSKKSNSSTFVLSRRSSSQQSGSQPTTV